MKLAIFGNINNGGGDILPNGAPEGVTFTNIPDFVSTVFTTLISVATAIFVILLLIGGIQYLVSAGNDEATSKAKRMLLDAIIGLVIVLIAWAAGHWILAQLNA